LILIAVAQAPAIAQISDDSATRPGTSASTHSAAQPTTAAIDPTTPKGALKMLARALDAGARATVLKLLWADSDQERRVASATADLAHATARLRAAAIRTFGAKSSRALGVDPGATPQAMARIDSATVETEDDHATVSSPHQEGPPMKLLRKDGTWHVPVAELSKDVEPADIERNLKDVASQTRLMEALTSEVLAGKFKTATDAREALDERILHSTMPELEPGATQPAPQP
jgi:hypothetical protein